MLLYRVCVVCGRCLVLRFDCKIRSLLPNLPRPRWLEALSTMRRLQVSQDHQLCVVSKLWKEILVDARNLVGLLNITVVSISTHILSEWRWGTDYPRASSKLGKIWNTSPAASLIRHRYLPHTPSDQANRHTLQEACSIIHLNGLIAVS